MELLGDEIMKERTEKGEIGQVVSVKQSTMKSCSTLK